MSIKMSADDLSNLIHCDEDEEDNASMQRQVLFVPSIREGEDLSGPPMDGFEFLKRVVEEKKRCDGVVVKKVDIKPQKNLATLIIDFPDEKCSPEFHMDKDAQLHTISEFSKLRLRYEARRTKIPQHELKKLRKSLPGKTNEAAWLKIFSNTPPNVADTMGLQNPSIELCLAMSLPKICGVMEFMEDWLTEGELSIPVACQWIYILLACIELPLDPDMHATLRGIARALISRRSQLESLASEELPHINIVVCIIGRYFNQCDLADPMD